MSIKKPPQIRPAILLPLAFSLIILLLTFLGSANWMMQKTVEDVTEMKLENVVKLLEEEIDQETELLLDSIQPIMLNEEIYNSFTNQDRVSLLRHSQPIYNEHFSIHKVSHFYFHTTEGVSFLRVHQPYRHGDKISRTTLKKAMQSDMPGTGLEIGPLGTFTLRVVRPWYKQGKLIGYIELGKEIEYLINDIKRILNVDLIVSLKKNLIDKAVWAENNHLAQTKQWLIFDQFVVTNKTVNHLPDLITNYLTTLESCSKESHLKNILKTEFNGNSIVTKILPLLNAAEEDVGDIYIIQNTTKLKSSLKQLSKYVIVVFLIIGSALFLFFFVYLSKLQKRMTASRNLLKLEITERQKAEEDLKEAKNLAESANLAKSEFLANMSHEIRTPMNGILGFSEILMSSNKIVPEEKEYVSLIKESADRLLDLMNNILDFSKIEAHKITLERNTFSLKQLLSDVVKLMEVRAAAKELKLELNIDPYIVDTLSGDHGRLRQILINLLNNAIKFTEIGQVTIDVYLDKQKSDKKLNIIHFKIKDTGIGIPKEKQSLIFDSFTQADGSTTRKYGGTGLGLTISKQLAELMGGRMWMESEPEVGSTFHFTVNLNPVHLSDRQLPEERAGISTEKKDGKNKKILLAEDDEINKTLAVSLLEEMNYNVVSTNNGQEALDAYFNDDFDLVLMDVQMPIIDGLEATIEIRKNDKIMKKQTPIIALTAHAMKKDKEKCLRAGMDNYLSKPIKADALYNMIEKYIGAK